MAIKERPEDDILFGVQIACGIYGEWHQWGTDVSRPMREKFKRFLLEKYKSQDDLQKAWNDKSVTFETAAFHPETFQAGDEGFFRNPELSRRISDAQECVQMTAPEAILTFAKVIKRCLPEKIVGTFYGYYFDAGEDNKPIGGHLKPEMLYRAKNEIDFLCGPFCYLKNRDASGVPMQRGMLESARLHGMLWLTEMDQHPECVPELGGDVSETDKTIATLRRNVLQPLCMGQGLWYYDHRVIPKLAEADPRFSDLSGIYRKAGWWESESLMCEIKKLQDLALRMTNTPYESSADVLLVYDTDSYYNRSKVHDFEYEIYESFARSGVVFDILYAKDLRYADRTQYKCAVFVNVYTQTAEEKRQYSEFAKDMLCVHLYAEGFCDGETLSDGNLSETVGMTVKKVIGQKGGVTGCSLFSGEDLTLPQNSLNPMFAVVDPSAQPLALYENGAVAAALKNNNLWIATPCLSPKIARKILSFCGAHCWTESENMMFAGCGVAVMNCTSGGKQSIHFPNGEIVPETLEPFTTAVYDLKTAERLL